MFIYLNILLVKASLSKKMFIFIHYHVNKITNFRQSTMYFSRTEKTNLKFAQSLITFIVIRIIVSYNSVKIEFLGNVTVTK